MVFRPMAGGHARCGWPTPAAWLPMMVMSNMMMNGPNVKKRNLKPKPRLQQLPRQDDHDHVQPHESMMDEMGGQSVHDSHEVPDTSSSPSLSFSSGSPVNNGESIMVSSSSASASERNAVDDFVHYGQQTLDSEPVESELDKAFKCATSKRLFDFLAWSELPRQGSIIRKD